MPKGRQKIDTFVVNESYRARLNDFIRKQVALGGQCYIVCPSIERPEDDVDAIVPCSTSELVSENSLKLKNVVEYTEMLKTALPEITIDLLHGKMKAAEKDAVVAFNIGNIHPMDLGTLLDRLGVAIRTGHHCAQPLMQHYGVESMARASFALYNTKAEIDNFIKALDRVRKMF
jgi:hypothetical protein